MSRPIAAIDTDVLITLLDTTSKPEAKKRKGYVELTIETLEKQGARWVVPSPVIAELCRNQAGSAELREIVRIALRRLRVEVLDEDAADIAGQIARLRLQSRKPDDVRGAIKYDALIAAIAHKIGARWLLTANRRHMTAALASIASNVQVVVATEPPATGQQVMLEVLMPGSGTAKS
jgi:predicted nucleic acid-binding protein